MTAKNMPYKHGFGPFAGEVYRAPMSYPFRDGLSGADAAARAIDVLEKQVGADNLAALAIEPIQGEGGFVVPAEGFLPALSAWAERQRHRVHRRRDPVRLLPHRRLVRLRPRGRRPRPDHHRQGHRRRHAAGRRHRPRRPDGRRPRRRPRRHLRRQPGRVRRRAGLHRGDEAARPGRPRPRDRRPDARAAARARGAAPGGRRHPRPRRDDGHRAVRARHHRLPTPPEPPPSTRTATGTAWSPSPAAPGATSSASCPRCRSATPCSTRRSTSSPRPSTPPPDERSARRGFRGETSRFSGRDVAVLGVDVAVLELAVGWRHASRYLRLPDAARNAPACAGGLVARRRLRVRRRRTQIEPGDGFRRRRRVDRP